MLQYLQVFQKELILKSVELLLKYLFLILQLVVSPLRHFCGLLEQDDWEELVTRIEAQKGVPFNKDALAIYQAALDAQEVEVEEKAKK